MRRKKGKLKEKRTNETMRENWLIRETGLRPKNHSRLDSHALQQRKISLDVGQFMDIAL